MSLRSSAEHENGGVPLDRIRLLPSRRGKVGMGVLSRVEITPSFILPRQEEGMGDTVAVMSWRTQTYFRRRSRRTRRIQIISTPNFVLFVSFVVKI
jgi:hypothetical protein